MYIENISAFLKEQLPLKLKFLEGNTIFGQIITLEDGKGAIKLYDGTIIPAIFMGDDKLEKNKYTKFVIQNFDGEQMILKAYTLENQALKEQSLGNILDNLNIPYDKGKDIIMNLIKFNLPATDENIMSIYKNINFIDIIRNMDDNEIIEFLQKNINPSINKNSREFSISKEIFSNLKDLNSELLSFLKENNMSLSLNNILNTEEFIKNKFYFNSLIDELKNTIILDKAALTMDNGKDLDGNFLPLFKFLNDTEKTNKLTRNIQTLNEISIRYNIEDLKSIDDTSLLILLKNKFDKSITMESDEFKDIKDILDNYTRDDFKSFSKLIESVHENFNKNNIQSINNKDILNYIKNNMNISVKPDSTEFKELKKMILDILDTSEGLQPFIELNTSMKDNNLKIDLKQVISKLDFNEKVISSLKKIIGSDEKSITITSLNDAIKSLSEDANLIKNLPTEIQSKLLNNINVLGHLNENYSFYFLNLYNNSNTLRNAIIVKNKYKSSKYIDINDVKTFITIDTSRLGTVDGYLYKKNNDLFISIKIQKQFVSLVKNNLSLLKNSLVNKKYNVINISVEDRNAKENLSSLSNFFSDGIFKELDVRV